MIKVIIHITKIIIAVVTALLFFSCDFVGNFKSVSGSGNVVTQNRQVSPNFNSVSAGNGLQVTIEQTRDRAVIVEADDNLQEHIKTVVEDSVLKISADVNIRNASEKKVTVRLPEIENIESSSGSFVKSENVLKGDFIGLSSSSGSKMDIEVDAENITCDSSSGSHLNVNGRADNLETDSSSGSKIEAKDLVAKKVKCEASSGSKTIVKSLSSLSAKASSGAKIVYSGSPQSIEKKTSSGGDVSHD